MYFVNEKHKQAMEMALQKAGEKAEQLDIKIPLYVLTSITPFQRMDQLKLVFDFRGCYFNPDTVSRLPLSTGEKTMVALALNLYNGSNTLNVSLSPYQALNWISEEHRLVYMTAITSRFYVDKTQEKYAV